MEEKIVKRKCKHCGTEVDEEFKKMNGEGSWINICTQCYSKNKSKQISGKNNPNWNGGPIDQIGKCKHCGTEVEDEFKRESGIYGVTVCAKCDFEGRSERNSGENHPMYTGLIPKKIKGICKQCGTQNKEDFKRKSGSYGSTICTKCCSNNISGKNHPNWRNKKIDPIGICKYCKTENPEDFIRMTGNSKPGKTVCTKCMSDNMSGKNHPMYKKHPSPEALAKRRDGRMGGENHPMFNKHHSPESCAQMSESRTGEKNHMYNKHHSRDARLNISNSKRLSFEEFKEKYPLMCLLEETRELPEEEWEVGMSHIQFKCKKCDEWFTPTLTMVHNRNIALNISRDGSYFYCSDECKNSCPIFRLNINKFLNNLNRSDSEPIQNSPEYNIFRIEVLNRQLKRDWYNHCEKCYSTKNLNVHHEKPQKTHPHMAIDPDNGVILCGKCHNEIGHQGSCSAARLANLVCKEIKNDASGDLNET